MITQAALCQGHFFGPQTAVGLALTQHIQTKINQLLSVIYYMAKTIRKPLLYTFDFRLFTAKAHSDCYALWRIAVILIDSVKIKVSQWTICLLNM